MREFYFDSEKGMHMSCENDEENAYGLDLDLLIILSKLHVS